MCRGAAKLGATGGDCPPREGAGGRGRAAQKSVGVGGICAKYCVCGGVRALLGFAMIYITACQKASRGLAY